MEEIALHKEALAASGFTVINEVFSEDELAQISAILDALPDNNSKLFRRSEDLFAIRQFLKVAPSVKPMIFSQKFLTLLETLFGNDFFIVKSIYFDKPPRSNWFVSCHQDLTISVKEKTEVEGFGPWTVKQDQFAVQPPLPILEDNFTVRIHLDDTTKENGALKVISGSHLKGIYRPELVDRSIEEEIFCEVKKGGIMIMRPLLLHASNRTSDEGRRRVIHIEFSRQPLPGGLQWAEKEMMQQNVIPEKPQRFSDCTQQA